MIGPLFLYSTSPAPHEVTILSWARRRRSDPATPLSAVVMQTALNEPSEAELDGLRSHFCTQGVDVRLEDSGLATRPDAHRNSVADRLAAADLLLITGGSPDLLCERTTGTPALAALQAASDSGAVIAGCSAGAAVIGAGMPIGKGEGRRPVAFWGWLPRTLVAPHFGHFDIEPWLEGFPQCTVLGIPNDAMALIVHGAEVRNIGNRALTLKTNTNVQQLEPAHQTRLPVS
jgi:cyanophycinase